MLLNTKLNYKMFDVCDGIRNFIYYTKQLKNKNCSISECHLVALKRTVCN